MRHDAFTASRRALLPPRISFNISQRNHPICFDSQHYQRIEHPRPSPNQYLTVKAEIVPPIV
jgi:hypothetical protein